MKTLMVMKDNGINRGNKEGKQRRESEQKVDLVKKMNLSVVTFALISLNLNLIY